MTIALDSGSGIAAPATPDPGCTAHRHGTVGAARHAGCTCRAARVDKKFKDYLRATGRPQTVDATGTRRRLQALMAIGWPGRTLMAECGWPGAALGYQMYQGTRVYRATAAAISDLYDRLSATPGPSPITRSRARAKGWAPPLAWDDEAIDNPAAEPWKPTPAAAADDLIDWIAVDRAVAGDLTVRLTRAERYATYAKLRRLGHPVSREQQNQLGINGRTQAAFERYLNDQEQAA